MPVSVRAVRTAVGLGVAALTLAACAVVAAPAGATSVSSITDGGVAKTAAALKKAPSGRSMPIGDPPGFHQVLKQDFTTAAALGTFGTKSPYTGWDGGTGYNGHADTSGNGTWNAKTTVSVHGGVLDCRVHATTPGRADVCAITPTGSNGAWWAGNGGGLGTKPYGRYSVRFKADGIPDYKIAWLLWPVDWQHWEYGEVDFPEGELNGTITAAAHDVGDPENEAYHDLGVRMTSWHTATIEWRKASLRYFLDGKLRWTVKNSATVTRVPTKPMRWVLQAETSLTQKKPVAFPTGHIYIDWVTGYTVG